MVVYMVAKMTREGIVPLELFDNADVAIAFKDKCNKDFSDRFHTVFIYYLHRGNEE